MGEMWIVSGFGWDRNVNCFWFWNEFPGVGQLWPGPVQLPAPAVPHHLHCLGSARGFLCSGLLQHPEALWQNWGESSSAHFFRFTFIYLLFYFYLLHIIYICIYFLFLYFHFFIFIYKFYLFICYIYILIFIFYIYINMYII